MDEKKHQKDWIEYEEIKQQFIHVISKNMNLYGITPSIGRLYGVLYFADEPMTLDEMRDALGMSKTSMSTGVRSLEQMKMVTPKYKKGIRKDLYGSEEDWYKSFTTLFSTMWKSGTEINIEELEDAKQRLIEMSSGTSDVQLKEQVDKDIGRLTYALDYYEWLLEFIELVESGDIFNIIPKKDK